MEPSDETLCRGVADGDEAAFDALVGRYRERAHRLAWSLLRDAEDAREVSQDAFVRLHRAARTFDGRARFSTWFYRILVNVCLDHRRRQRWWRRIFRGTAVGGGGSARRAAGDEPGTPLLDQQPAPFEDPADAVARERLMRRLWQAVEALPAQQRAALTLQVQEGLPTAEIAQVLRCAEATVRVHLHRALSALRKSMEETQ